MGGIGVYAWRGRREGEEVFGFYVDKLGSVIRDSA